MKIPPMFSKIWVKIALFCCSLILIYLLQGEDTLQHFSAITSQHAYNSDALQHIPPTWRYYNQSCLQNDYITDYYSNAILPPLFKFLYFVGVQFGNPIEVSHAYNVILWLLYLFGVALVVVNVSGVTAGYIALLFANASLLHADRFAGGIQRAFGTTLIPYFILFLCKGNELALATLALVAIAVYPAAGVLMLITLGIFMLSPAGMRNQTKDWHIKYRVIALFIVGIASFAIMWPQLQAGQSYGMRLTYLDEAQYPETGAGGRYSVGDQGRLTSLGDRIYRLSKSALSHPTDPAAFLVVVVTVAAALLIAIRKRNFSIQSLRIAIFGASIVAAHYLAVVLFPLAYIPTRYTGISLPTYFIVILPISLIYIFSQLIPKFGKIGINILVFIVSISMYLYLHADTNGRPLLNANSNAPLYTFIRNLPEDSLIAGWPRGVVNTVPYFTCKPVFISLETHQVFHENYLIEMRKRMNLITEAFTSKDHSVLIKLRDQYKVTHLIVTNSDLKRKLRYFAPFDSEIKHKLSVLGNSRSALEDMLDKLSVYHRGSVRVLSLAKLSNITDVQQ